MRDVQACTIGLPINENLKLEKGKKKNSSAVRRFMRSSSYVSSRDHVHHNPRLPYLINQTLRRRFVP